MRAFLLPSLIPNSMEIWEVSLIPLRGTELLKEGDFECNNFGESNKVMNGPLYKDTLSKKRVLFLSGQAASPSRTIYERSRGRL